MPLDNDPLQEEVLSDSQPSPGEEFASGGETGQSSVKDLPDTNTGGVVTSSPTADTTESASPQGGLLSVVEAARQAGLDLGNAYEQGDYATFQALVQRAQQADQLRQQIQQQDFYARLGQQIAPHADRIQQYLAQQQQPKQSERNPWEPPIDRTTAERYMQLCEQDPNGGTYIPKPGAPPEFARSLNDYQEYMRNFLANPADMITKAAEHVAAKTFDQRFEERYQAIQRQQAVDSILRENSSWMYQVGPDGSPVRDGSNRPAYTPAGVAYVQALQSLRQGGMNDPVAMNALAIQIARGSLYAQQHSATQTQQVAAPAQQRALQGSGPNRNPLQALSSQEIRETPGATDPSFGGLDFRGMLRREFAKAGVKDEDMTPEAFSG